MRIKMCFPIAFQNLSITMAASNYPIEFDGKVIGMGKVIECNNFEMLIETDKNFDDYYHNNLTQNEKMSFSIA